MGKVFRFRRAAEIASNFASVARDSPLGSQSRKEGSRENLRQVSEKMSHSVRELGFVQFNTKKRTLDEGGVESSESSETPEAEGEPASPAEIREKVH